MPQDSDSNSINDDWEVANSGVIGINPDGDNDAGAIQATGVAAGDVENVTVTLSDEKPLFAPHLFVRVRAE